MRKRSPGSLAILGWLFAIGWISVSTGSVGLLFAQLRPPNESGVSIGHVHLTVRSPEAHKKLWVDMLGAQVTHSGSLELLRLPGIFIVLQEGEPTAGSAGSSVNHIGLWIKDHTDIKAKVTAASLEISSNNYDALKCAAAPGTPACQMTVVFPDGVRVEFTEDKTLSATAASHHIHAQTTDPESLAHGTPRCSAPLLASAVTRSWPHCLTVAKSISPRLPKRQHQRRAARSTILVSR